MRKTLALIVAVFTAIALMFAFMPANATGSGGKEKVGVCHRTGSDSNPYVYIEVPKDEANGHITGDSKQHNQKVTWKSDGTWNGVEHKAGDLKLDYYANEEDKVTKCGERSEVTPTPTPTPTSEPTSTPTSTPTEPTPTHTPDPTPTDNPEPTESPTETPTSTPTEPCDDACKMPIKDTDAPEVTKCVGVLSGKVLNDVVVPAGFSCTLVDSWVNGDVVADGVRNVTLADTPVVGDVIVKNASGDFTFGPKGGDCRYDPMVGGSIIVKSSHNVLVCQAQVCEDIIIKRNDGKITVRDTLDARRLVVVGNKRFKADDSETHNAAHVIRLINNTVDELVVKKNAPRRVAVR